MGRRLVAMLIVGTVLSLALVAAMYQFALASDAAYLYKLFVKEGSLLVEYVPAGKVIINVSSSNVSVGVPLYVEGNKVVTEGSLTRYLSSLEERLSSYIESNATYLRRWVESNYMNVTEVSRAIRGNFSACIGTCIEFANRNILGNVSNVLSTVSRWISGNYTALKSWVESNYYSKSVIDSWNLIKNYTLQQNLNANGHAIIGIGTLSMKGWSLIPSSSALKISNLGNGETFALASNGTLRAPLVHSDTLWVGNATRYFKMFFGTRNDLEFNGSAMIIHPAWGSKGYNPSGLVYISNDSSYVKVGIGTDNPQYRLDVNGDIRAKGATVYADYFHFTERGNPTEFYLDYFPNSINGVNAIGVAVNRVPKTFVDTNGYVYAPRFYITEEGQYTSPKFYIDWYPDDTLRITHYPDNAQPLIVYPFGVATGFSFDRNTLQRIQSFQTYHVGIAPGSWGTVVNVTFTGTVIACIYSGDWVHADGIEIDLDGVTKTFTLSNNPATVSFCLTFVVSKSLVIKVHNSDTTLSLGVDVAIIEVSK